MYTTVGRRSTKSLDWCEHEHPTLDDAQKCLVSHQNELRKVGQLSKRQIVEVESIDELREEAELY